MRTTRGSLLVRARLARARVTLLHVSGRGPLSTKTESSGSVSISHVQKHNPSVHRLTRLGYTDLQINVGPASTKTQARYPLSETIRAFAPEARRVYRRHTTLPASLQNVHQKNLLAKFLSSLLFDKLAATEVAVSSVHAAGEKGSSRIPLLHNATISLSVTSHKSTCCALKDGHVHSGELPASRPANHTLGLMDGLHQSQNCDKPLLPSPMDASPKHKSHVYPIMIHMAGIGAMCNSTGWRLSGKNLKCKIGGHTCAQAPKNIRRWNPPTMTPTKIPMASRLWVCGLPSSRSVFT